jgi:ribosomal protein S18 acetylase RimI-like enzyme
MEEVIVRPGREDDGPYIKEFTKDTFDWGDYVGDAYAGWVKDMENGTGDVYVALAGGRPVGVTHVQYMSPAEAWFEGIRVHPDYRRAGIGRLLTAASIEGARRRRARVCRAAIDPDNEKSSRLAASFGFSLVRSVVQYIADLEPVAPGAPLPGPAWPAACLGVSFLKAGPEDAPAIFEAASKEMAYIGSDFCWWEMTPENVAQALSSRKVLLARSDDGRILAGGCLSETWVDQREGEQPALCGELSSAFGEERGIAALTRYVAERVRREAAARDLHAGRLFITCEEGSPVTESLPVCGFRRAYEQGQPDTVGLWELRLDG